MFENSALFGVMEDGTIKKFLMEKSIGKLCDHFSKLYGRYSGFESARLRHVAGSQWGNKKYMNTKHLDAASDDALIAG